MLKGIAKKVNVQHSMKIRQLMSTCMITVLICGTNHARKIGEQEKKYTCWRISQATRQNQQLRGTFKMFTDEKFESQFSICLRVKICKSLAIHKTPSRAKTRTPPYLNHQFICTPPHANPIPTPSCSLSLRWWVYRAFPQQSRHTIQIHLLHTHNLYRLGLPYIAYNVIWEKLNGLRSISAVY